MNILGQTTTQNVSMALHKGDISALTTVLEAEPYIARTCIQPRGPQGDENRPLLHVTTAYPSHFTRCDRTTDQARRQSLVVPLDLHIHSAARDILGRIGGR